MTIPEFIGFVVTMIGLAIISYRNHRAEQHRRQHPEQYEEEERQSQRRLREFLGEMGMEEEDIPPELTVDKPIGATPVKTQVAKVRSHQTPKPQRTMGSDFRFQSEIERKRQVSRIDTRRFDNAIEEREKTQFERSVVSSDMSGETLAEGYHIIHRRRESRAQQIIRRLANTQDMMIFHEILLPPKALRRDEWP